MNTIGVYNTRVIVRQQFTQQWRNSWKQCFLFGPCRTNFRQVVTLYICIQEVFCSSSLFIESLIVGQSNYRLTYSPNIHDGFYNCRPINTILNQTNCVRNFPYPLMYVDISQVVSSPQIIHLKMLTHFLSLPCLLHASPISFCFLWSS
jgi:hypothetical protein